MIYMVYSINIGLAIEKKIDGATHGRNYGDLEKETRQDFERSRIISINC